MRKPNDDETTPDLIVFCGLDGRNSPLWKPLISNAYGRTASVHMYRMNEGYYTRRNGVNMMAEKSGPWYARHMVDMSRQRGTEVIMWCKTNETLLAKTCKALWNNHSVRARFYVLNSKVGIGADNRVRIDGLAVDDGWWV